MRKTNESLEISDLVRPLSLEAVQYFGSDTLPKSQERHTSRRGKFIRIGKVMIIGTTLSYGKKGHLHNQETVQHWQLLRFLQEDKELFEMAHPSISSEPAINSSMLHDAGATYIEVDEDGQPTELELFGQSTDYGRADEVGRQRSIDVAQSLVGPTIRVVSSI